MSHSQKIWVIDDDNSIRWVLEKALDKAGLDVTSFDSGTKALQALQKEEPAVIISDIRMPGIGGLELLEQIGNTYPKLPVIIMTAHSDLDSAVSAYKGGAFEYLPKPFDVDDAIALARRALKRAQWLLKHQPKDRPAGEEDGERQSESRPHSPRGGRLVGVPPSGGRGAEGRLKAELRTVSVPWHWL